MMDVKMLGKKIREKREEIGIPPSTLARKAGIARTTLWMLEQGENHQTGKPSRTRKAILLKVADALRITLEEKEAWVELAGYKGEKRTSPSAGEGRDREFKAARKMMVEIASPEPGQQQRSEIQLPYLKHAHRPRDIFSYPNRPEPKEREESAPTVYLSHRWLIIRMNASFARLLQEVSGRDAIVIKPEWEGKYLLQLLFSPLFDHILTVPGNNWSEVTQRLIQVFLAVVARNVQADPSELVASLFLFADLGHAYNLFPALMQLALDQEIPLPDISSRAVPIGELTFGIPVDTSKIQLHGLIGTKKSVEGMLLVRYTCLLSSNEQWPYHYTLSLQQMPDEGLFIRGIDSPSQAERSQEKTEHTLPQ